MSEHRDDFIIAIRSALLKRGARQRYSLFFLISLSKKFINFKLIFWLQDITSIAAKNILTDKDRVVKTTIDYNVLPKWFNKNTIQYINYTSFVYKLYI